MANNSWISTASTDYNVAGNWTDGVPTAADVVGLENSNIDINATLDQSAVALTSWTQFASYTGKIGVMNLLATPGTTGTYLQIDAATVVLGRKLFPEMLYNGSQRLMIDIGSGTACAIRVESTAAQGTDGLLPPVRLKGNDTAHVLTLWEGFIGVACARFDETSTFGTLNLGRMDFAGRKCRALLGLGLTINTALNVNAGKHLALCTIPTGNIYGGELHHNGAGTVSTSVTVHNGAKYVWNGTGTAVAVTVKKGGTFDYSNATGTITTLTFDDKNDLIESNAVTVTNRVPTGKEGPDSGA